MATIAALIIDVAANTAKLQTDVQKIHGTLDGVTGMAGKVGTALAGAFTITAITGAITKVLNYADQISNLSAQTGLAKKTLQEMDFVASVTGASLESFANAAFKLGVALAGGGSSVVGAVERLGLSWYQLKQMSVDQQFNTIMVALGGVQSAQERNKLAVELFGKAAKDILPAIAQGYDNIAARAIVSSDAQIDALDQAGDALDAFLAGAKSVGIYLAGGLAITIRETTNYVIAHSAAITSVRRGLEQWATVLELAGMKGQELPKVLNASTAAARNMPAPLSSAAMSVADLQAAERKLTAEVNLKIEANKKALKAQEGMNASQKRFADSIQRLDTAEFFVPFAKSVEQASFELKELDSTIPSVVQQLMQFKAPVQEATRDFETFGDRVRTTMIELPNVILQAIQGGGSIIGSAGSFIGTSLMSKFQEKFGPAIAAALPFGIGNAINALLPTLGALFGPIAERIGGFFKSIFGGPSADELRGRQAVADFEAQLHSLLTETQRLDAGNQSWKMTVIAIRDAYIAQGLSEMDALAAAEKLWASSKSGGAASQAVIEEIKRVMEGGAAAAGQFAANLDSATRNRTINIGFNVADIPDLGGGVDWGGPQARGGDYFVNRPTLFLAGEAGPERASFSGANRQNDNQGGGSSEVMERLIRDLPRAMKIAFADAIALQGGV